MPPKTFSGSRTVHLTGTADGTLPFIGRTTLLRLAALRLQADRGTVLVGPSGIGKTRTLHQVEDAAEAAGRRVARIVATRSTSAVPFGAFLSQLSAEAIDHAVGMTSLDRALLVRSGVLALDLDVLGVDDAHLLDEQSAALLLDLARTGTTVVMVLEPAADAPDALLSMPEAMRAETVELPPFSAAESAELIEAVLRGPVDGGTALVLHEAALGVPLTLRELLDALVRDGGVAMSEGLWALTETVHAPSTVQARVLDRLRELDGVTRDWVQLVAVAHQVPIELAPVLVDEAAADRAELTAWVRPDEVRGVYRLDHELDREPVLKEMGPRARRRALRALLTAIEALERPLSESESVDRGRWRLELGEPVARAEALHLAATTSPADPALAERFLREAARDDEPLALVALAQHLITSGRAQEAERLLDRARAAGGQEVRVAALTALARGLAERRSQEALEQLEQVLAEHPDEPDLLAVQVALMAAEGRTEQAVAVAGHLQSLPSSAGTVLGEVYGAMAMAVRGDQSGALRVAEDLRKLAEANVRSLPEGPMMQAWLEAAVPWTETKDPNAACEIAQRGYDRTLRGGLRPDRARFAHLLAVGRLLQGDATVAVQLLREAESAPCLWRDSRRPEIVADLAVALVLSGDQAEAERTLERLDGMRRTPEQQPKQRLARAAVLMGRGDRSAAADAAIAVGDAAAALGERVAAADGWTDALRYGSALAAQRLLDQADGPEGAIRDLVREHASAHLAHDGAALLQVAQGYWRLDARVYAVEAAATAARWALEAQDTVGATGATELLLRWQVATPGLVDPLAEAVPLAGLTAREQEIARLAAAGVPDRSIAVELGISVRTAQTHLARAFAKLGVHRRQELARLLPPPAEANGSERELSVAPARG